MPSHPDHPAPDEALAQQVAALAASVADLERRLQSLEQGRSTAPAPTRRPAPEPEPESEAPLTSLPWAHPGALVGLLGRLCLALGGAFLIRAITDGGTLPKEAGVALGFVYGLAWAFAGDRFGRKGDLLQAASHALTAALILFPLLIETTLKLSVLTPPLAALLLLVATVVLVGVGWRHALHTTTWLVTLGSLGTGLVLMAGSASLRTFALLFLGLGGASLWLTYGRRWHGLRWPVALAANGTVLLMDLLCAWPGGPPEAHRGLTPGTVIPLSLTLVLVYLGSFVVRTLQLHRAVNPFEIAQTIAVLVVGFGGAVHVSQVSGAGSAMLGLAALPVGAACYLVAFLFMERHTDAEGNFRFFASLALVFILGGCLITLAGPTLLLAMGVLGVLAAGLGIQYQRATLLTHSAVFLTLAAMASGLVTRSLEVFAQPTGPGSPSLTAVDGALAVVLAGVHVLGVLRRPTRLLPLQRTGSLALALWAALPLTALGVVVLGGLLLGRIPDPGAMAALRTVVLSLVAVLLALGARRLPTSEVRWLVVPLLGLTALKLLLEDLAQGRPLTLFVALSCFGGALIVAPRLLKPSQPQAAVS